MPAVLEELALPEAATLEVAFAMTHRFRGVFCGFVPEAWRPVPLRITLLVRGCTVRRSHNPRGLIDP